MKITRRALTWSNAIMKVKEWQINPMKFMCILTKFPTGCEDFMMTYLLMLTNSVIGSDLMSVRRLSSINQPMREVKQDVVSHKFIPLKKRLSIMIPIKDPSPIESLQ